MSKYDILKLENQMCFPLYAISREVIKLYKPYLDQLNLTYTQYIAMLVMWEEEKIVFKELGKKLHLDSGTLTPVLKKLESMGLIIKYRSKEDDRVVIVELTETGRKLKDPAPGRRTHRCKFKISEEDAVQFKYYLDKILKSFV